MQNLSSAAVVIGALRVNIRGIKIRRFLRLPYWCILNLAAFQFMSVSVICLTSYEATVKGKNILSFIPLFHTGPESHELTRIDKYLDSWLNRTQFMKVLTDSRSL